jgi:hypothetical protein
MRQMLRYSLPDGNSVVVDVEGEESGVARAGRAGDAIASALMSFEEAMADVRRAAEAMRQQFDGGIRPAEVEIEFGVRMSAEVGAVIAKSGAEAQLKVHLTWSATAA